MWSKVVDKQRSLQHHAIVFPVLYYVRLSSLLYSTSQPNLNDQSWTPSIYRSRTEKCLCFVKFSKIFFKKQHFEEDRDTRLKYFTVSELDLQKLLIAWKYNCSLTSLTLQIYVLSFSSFFLLRHINFWIDNKLFLSVDISKFFSY